MARFKPSQIKQKMRQAQRQAEQKFKQQVRQAEQKLQHEVDKVNRENKRRVDAHNRKADTHNRAVIAELNRRLRSVTSSVRYTPPERQLADRVHEAVAALDPREYDTFLSYARIDGAEVAGELRAKLEELGNTSSRRTYRSDRRRCTPAGASRPKYKPRFKSPRRRRFPHPKR